MRGMRGVRRRSGAAVDAIDGSACAGPSKDGVIGIGRNELSWWLRPQMSIALFGDPAQSALAAGRMLLGHQPDPRGETAARGERRPISNFGPQRGGDDRANTGDFLQPPARFTRAVP